MDFIPPILAYVIVAHPETYKLTSKFLGGWISSPDGAAKLGGLLLHAVVFLFLMTLIYNLFPRSSGYSHMGWGKGHETHRGSPMDLDGSPLAGRV